MLEAFYRENYRIVYGYLLSLCADAGMRTMLNYVDGDLTGYVDRIGKYMSVISEERELETVYSVNYDVATGDADYKKSAPETHWYDFLFD